MEFRNQPLGEVLRLFCKQTGSNIVASPEAQKVPISLFLHDITPEAALDALCKANDLWHKQDKESGIIRIYTTKEYQRDLTSFREEQTEVFTLLYPNPVDVAAAIRSVFGDRVVLSLQSQDQDTYQGLIQRFNRFDVVDQRTQGFGLLSGTNGIGGTGGYGGGMGGYGGSAGIGGYGGTNGMNGTSGYGGLGTLTGPYMRQDQSTAGRTDQYAEKTREIPLREEFKGLSPEEIEALEATATGEGKLNTAMVEALMARRRPRSMWP